MSVRAYVTDRVRELLRDRRMVVWYDPDGELGSVFDVFEDAHLVKVDARASVLRARRQADAVWIAICDADRVVPDNRSILVYVPWRRGPEGEENERREDPFEPFALAGASFGDSHEDRLPALARKAFPGREPEVDRLFAAGRPTLDQLDAFAAGARYPVLRAALGADEPAKVAADLLCRPQAVREAARNRSGLLDDLRRLLRDAYGFAAEDVPSDELAPAFARWVLWSEFVFDLPGAIPRHLAEVPRAPGGYREAIYPLCARLRDSAELRERYKEIAHAVEGSLGLASLTETITVFGDRDTFPFEDRAALDRLQTLALQGATDDARVLLERRRHSVWRTEPERDLLWRLAERCLEMLDGLAAWKARAVGAARPVTDHIRAYCSPDDGLARVDRAQRWVEQSAAQLHGREELTRLVDHTRRLYRETLDAAQDTFLSAVEREGWPPEGVPKQIEAWSRHAAPVVRDGRKVAWLMVDALRFEMGQELSRQLASLGASRVECAAGVIPASTTFGMAALVPGADVAFDYAEVDGEVVPRVAGRPVRTPAERLAAFRTVLGDRVADLKLGELIDGRPQQVQTRLAGADVVVVRSTEIDALGENSDPLFARRYMTDLVRDLRTAADRLARAGFRRMVFVADHGFVQFPEALPGDVVAEPAGHWALQKRRALLGAAGGRAEGALVLDAARLGINGPVRQVCVPRRMRVFRRAGTYFHEGISLQECLIPIVVLDADPPKDVAGPQLVQIEYRQDRYTSRVFSVKVSYQNLTAPHADVRLVAVDPDAGKTVGQAADCEARHPDTGLVRLTVNQPVQVPILIDPDFTGRQIEVRAVDPATGRIHAALPLRNATLE